ncbi:MAG: hypothetical protein ACP5IT_06330 [Thermoproteota archaeon]|jgi:hypothetical protein
MTLLPKLRNEVCKKLRIKPRQLRNRVTKKAQESGIVDRDVALLLLAHEQGIDVAKPRFQVPKDKLNKLEEYLKVLPKIQITTSARTKGKVETKQVRFQHLLSFRGKYPEIFYDRLENEINIAYSHPELPNATLMLTRKLIENLVYNLLEYKFGGQKINLYYDINHRRAHDFGILLDNLKTYKQEFDVDQHEIIDKFLDMVQPFRRDVNAKVHKVMEYLETTKQLKNLKIPEMVQILLKLIDRVKQHPQIGK